MALSSKNEVKSACLFDSDSRGHEKVEDIAVVVINVVRNVSYLGPLQRVCYLADN
jgi:hypothetical protein